MKSIFQILLVFTLSIVCAQGQDNTPPVITMQPQDETHPCGGSDIIDLFTDWFNNNAGTAATDNSGIVNIESPYESLEDAIQAFQNSQDTLCGETMSLTIIFEVSDTSNNLVYTNPATFNTIDNIAPSIVSNPTPIVASCFPGIQDSLESWINNYGFGVMTDICSETVGGNIFLWSYEGQGGNTSLIGQGPYPQIPDDACNFKINFTFIRLDGCNNSRSTLSSFTVLDTIAPVFSSYPPDMVVSCENVMPADSLYVTDNCDSMAEMDFQETSTQNPDPTVCEHYNYTITRVWNTVDACTNFASHTQVVTVVDNEAPIFSLLDTIIIDCQQFEPFDPDVFFINYEENCSEIIFQYEDIGEVNACGSLFDRRYVVSDVCGNEFVFNQIIKVEDLSGPILSTMPSDFESSCDSGVDFEEEFTNWISAMEQITVSDSCSNPKVFVALPGSYTLNDTFTYPGTFPASLPNQQCMQVPGYLVYQNIDLVAYDDCGNTVVETAFFGIIDTLPPNISNCPSDAIFDTAVDNCEAEIMLPEVFVTDNCAESASPITKTVLAAVKSNSPGDNELPVNTTLLRLGPFFSNGISATGVSELKFSLNNLDADDQTEFFTVFSEDGGVLGFTPNTDIQCGDTTMILNNISPTLINDWLADGFIDFTFVPNVPADFGSLAINDVCSGSSIRCTFTFEVDITNPIDGKVVYNEDTLAYSDAIANPFILEIGSHDFQYIFTDCAQNSSTCIYHIDVEDSQPPILSCPGNILDTLAMGTCNYELAIPSGYTIEDNCKLNRVYNESIPPVGPSRLLTFDLVDATGLYIANNKVITFNDVFPILKTNSEPILKVHTKGDTDQNGEIFFIIGEDGTTIGATDLSEEECGSQVSTFTIPIAKFNEWAADSSMLFIAQAPTNPAVDGGGINPCNPVMGNNSNDGFSSLYMTLSFDDAIVYYTTTGALETPITAIDPITDSLFLDMPVGVTTVTYFASDFSQNTSSCSYDVEIIDNENPVAKCGNIAIQIHPSGVDDYIIDADEIDSGSTDNCELINRTVMPNIFNCDDVGTQLTVTLIVEDTYGNTSSCESLIRIDEYILQPTFNAGICAGDSLQLFANIPSSSNNPSYIIEWFKDGVLFSNEENPIIENFAGGQNINFHVVVTGFNGCRAEGSILVNFQPLISPLLTLSKTSGCLGDDLMLQCTAYSGDITYKWYEGAFPNGTLIDSTNSPILLLNPDTPGNRLYYIIAESEECDSNPSETKVYTAFEKPDVGVDNPFLNVCEGEDIILSTSVVGQNYKYSWFGPGFTSNIKQPLPILNASIANQGNYGLVINVGECYSDTATVIVNINERPTTPIITGEDVFCDGTNFSLLVPNVPNADAFEWSLNGVIFKVTNTNTISQVAGDNLAGNWTVTVREGDCISLPSQIKEITIEERIEVGASNDGPACVGDSVTLSSTFVPNATYTWNGPGVDNVQGQEITILAQPGDYSVTIRTASGCDNIGSTNVVVNSPPQITALSNNSQDCMDGMTDIVFQPTIFPAGSNYTYEWEGPNFSSPNLNATIKNATPANNGTYTLTVYFKGCPSESVSNEIDINLYPSTPDIIAPSFLCNGESLLLTTGLQDDEATYTWSTPKGIFETSSDSFYIENTNPTDEGTYFLTVSKDGCTSLDNKQVFVQIRLAPPPPQIVGNTEVCFEEQTTLAIIGLQPGDELFWDTPKGTINANQINISSAKLDDEGLYQVYLVRNGCQSVLSEPFNLNVLEEITIPQFTNDEVFVCLGDEDQIEFCLSNQSLTPGATYELLDEAGNQLLEINDNCFIIEDTNVLNEGLNILRARTILGDCTSKQSNNFVINIQSAPNLNAGVVLDSFTVCYSDDLVLVDAINGSPQVDVTWTALTPGLQISNETLQNTAVTNFSDGENYLLLSYSKDGCINFSTDTVKVILQSIPDLFDDNYTIGYNKSLVLSVEDNDDLPAEYNIEYSIDDEDGKLLIDENQVTYVGNPLISGSITFQYEICAKYCPELCDEAFVTIRIDDTDACIIPTIITPNDDGINDYFTIPCFASGKYENNDVKIFNQWGDEVYRAAPYQNDWAGTFGGKALPVGTYYYIVDLGNGSEILSGFIVLKR